MQTSRRFPGSSASSFTTSSHSSLSEKAHGSGGAEELESYLSLVAGEKEKRSKRIEKDSIDWGSLLENREELKTSRNAEEVVLESNEDLFHYLKPPSEKDKLVLKSSTEEERLGASKRSIKARNETLQNQTRPTRSLSDSLSLIDTILSDSESDDAVKSKNILRTLRPTEDTSRQSLHGTTLIKPGETSLEVQEKEKVTNTVANGKRSHSASIEYSLFSEENSSKSSLDQDLVLSSHVKNNIFTIDDLEPTHEDDHKSDSSAHSPDENSISEEHTGLGQLHNIVSIADLDSMPANSKADILPKPTKLSNTELYAVNHKKFDDGQEKVKSFASDLCPTTRQKENEEREIKRGEEEVEGSLRKEEDVLKGREMELEKGGKQEEERVELVSVDSEEYSLQWEDEEVVEEDEEEEYEEEEAEEEEYEGEEVEESGKDDYKNSQTSTNAINVEDLGENSPQAPVNILTVKDSNNAHFSTIPTRSNGTNAANTIEQDQITTRHLSNSKQSGSFKSYCSQRGMDHSSPLLLPEFPPHPRFASLLPHLLTTHTTTTAQILLEAQEELIRSQLELTKSLVTRSCSLAQSMTDSIIPDYHYTTLEDTKKYISRHRPRVLTTKEAQKLVSKELES